jgi:uncharacterized protein YqjF (DUF2071 family)
VARPFLTATWRHLAMLNWAVDPALVAPLVPRGTELDFWQGRTYLSVVGFLFLDTRVLGVPVPFHRDFEEINLRFYVRRGEKRAVAFVKEIVPRAAIAWTARALYNEPYVAWPTSHRIETAPAGHASRALYEWRAHGSLHRVALAVDAPPAPLVPGSEAEFIAEHYWGYTAQRDGGTVEYEVRHPPWRAAAATEARLECDVARVYGPQFAAALSGPPTSAFLAEGSPITVSSAARLRL